MNANLPAGPRSRFPLETELAWRGGAPEFLRRAAAEFGPVCGFTLKGHDIYFFSDPELVREVLVVKDKSFGRGPGYQKMKPWLGNGIVTSDGAVHQRQRRMIQPAFHRKRVEAYATVMQQSAHAAADGLVDGQQIDLLALMEQTAFSISTKAIFDADLDDKVIPFLADARRAVRFLDSMNSYSPTAIFKRLTGAAEREKAETVRLLHTMVDDIISARRQDTRDRGDLLSMLVNTLDEEGDGKGLSDEEVRDQVMTLLVAGFDTLSSSMMSTFYLLSRNPDAEAEVLAELREVLAGRPAELADLPRLTKTYAAFSEAIRLYPSAWVMPRTVVEEVTIGPVTIPVGAAVLVCPYVSQRDPRFFPQPDRFDLSRWTPEAKEARPKFAYFPFGAGSRVCMGEQFAWLEGVMMVASILPRWRFETAFSGPLRYRSTMSLRPPDGCPMIVRKR